MGSSEKHDLRLTSHGAGETHALLHTAGKFRRRKIGHFRLQTHFCQGVNGMFAGFAAAYVPVACHETEGHVFPHGQTVE